jgi:hypothetical protein
MNANFTLRVDTITHKTLDFKNVVKMESQYQIEEGDAYIVQFKNGALLFIAKDDIDYWYYQTDPTEDLQRGDIITPQPDTFDEIVAYIKSKSTYQELEDQVVDGVKIINIANQVWTVVN